MDSVLGKRRYRTCEGLVRDLSGYTTNKDFATSSDDNFRFVDYFGLIAGQACCLRQQVIPFRHTRRPRRRNSVVLDGRFVIAHLFKKMAANGVETIVTGNGRIAIESPKQFEAFGWAVHHSGRNGEIESNHRTGCDSSQQLIQGQDLWPICILYALGVVV